MRAYGARSAAVWRSSVVRRPAKPSSAAQANAAATAHGGTSRRSGCAARSGAAACGANAARPPRSSAISSPRRAHQVVELLGAFEQVAALEAEQQAQVEHLQHRQPRGAGGAQRLQVLEEALAGELLAEVFELQRAALPRLAQPRAGGEHRLVEQRAEGEAGQPHVVGGGAEPRAALLEVGEEGLDALAQRLRIGRRLAAAQQEDQVAAVEQQVGQPARALRIDGGGQGLGARLRRGAGTAGGRGDGRCGHGRPRATG